MRGDGKFFGAADAKSRMTPPTGDPAATDIEKSRFETWSEELKQGLFGGFYVMLRHSEQSTRVKFIIL